MHLKSVELLKQEISIENKYPFSMPLIQSLESISFTQPVTIFVGENGSGKSTVMEALAAAIGSITVGAQSVETDPSLESARSLARTMRLAWTKKTKKGFFLRSEDFLNYTRSIAALRAEMLANIAEVEEEYRDRSVFARGLAMSPYKKSVAELEKYYGEDLDANSHGESFFQLFHSRFVPGGLYLLDEPETPLSPMKQLAFLAMLKDMVMQDSQFIIATHSPIIMAFPEATLYNFDSIPLRQVQYDELEHVNLTRSFLNNPQSFLKHL